MFRFNMSGTNVRVVIDDVSVTAAYIYAAVTLTSSITTSTLVPDM